MRNVKNITELGMRKLRENDSYKRGDFHQAMLDIGYGDWQAHDAAIIYRATSGYGSEKVTEFEGTEDEYRKWWEKRIEESGEKKDDMLAVLRHLNLNPLQANEVYDYEHQKQWSYLDMLNHARSEYGEMFYLMTLAGKYNQQVGNGGHVQYFDNGYGDGDSGGFGDEHDTKLGLHREMVRELERTILPLTTGADEAADLTAAISIMKRLRVRVYHDKTVECDCSECDGTGKVDCSCKGADERCAECDGSGYVKCMYCDGSGTDECENDRKGCVENTDELSKLDDEWYAIDDRFEFIMNKLVMRECGKSDPDARSIYVARLLFDEEFEVVCKDDTKVMHTTEVFGGDVAAKLCYLLLVTDEIENKQLEAVRDAEDAVTGYVFNPATRAASDLNRRLYQMKPGEEIDYRNGICSAYDRNDRDGKIRQDIVDAYDGEINRMFKYGYVEAMCEGDEVVGYRRLQK